MNWKARDGRVIPISELETNHLKNIIRMLRRKGVVTPDEFMDCAAYACSGSTPDGAAMAAENELANMRPWSKLGKLEKELSRRRDK